MKKIENIVCILINITILITYIIAMNKINSDNTILYLISNGVCLIMITANLLLFKCLKNMRENNGNNN